MMEATEAMKAMAREIAARVNEANDCPFVAREMRAGNLDTSDAVRAALAAIIETQEACAKLADNIADVGVLDPGGIGWVVAEKIRTGEHYALAGGGRG